MGKINQAQQSAKNGLLSHWALPLILLIFVALAGAYSVVVPITQGEDELAHYRYISFIAQNGRLPVDNAERQQAWYRSDWPPLYHLIVGGLVSSLDTSQPRLKDVGESPRRRLVGQIFYPRLIIYTEDANWPWQDGILAWHIGRFSSILFSAAALVFVYLTAWEIGLNQRSGEKRTRRGDKHSISSPLHLFASSSHLLAVFSTALIAFTPRFIFTSAMLSDDSLFILLSAIFIWLMLRAGRGSDRWWMFALMGLILGLSITTKYSTGLLPLAFIPLVWWRTKQANWGWPKALGRLAVAWFGVVLGVSWWFGWIGYHFNTVSRDGLLFGLLNPLLAAGPDVSMRRVFDFFGGETFSGPLRPGAVAEGSFGEWWGYLFQTFWGVPVLEADPYFPWVYLLVLAFCLLSLFGLWRVWQGADSLTRMTIGLLILIFVLLFPFPLLRFFLTYNILETGQGRHILYPAAQSFAILLALGWMYVTGSKAGNSETRRRGAESSQKNTHHAPRISHYIFQFTFYLPLLALLLWSVTLLVTMARTYPDPLPVQTTTFDSSTIPQPLKHNFGEAIQFLGYNFEPDPTQAIINLTLYWQALAQVDENYRTRVQLVDPQGQPHFTWLSHPLNGLYPTRAWDKGDVIRDTLSLPLVAVPADTYTLQIDVLPEVGNTPLNPEPFWIIQIPLAQSQPITEAMPFNNRLEYRLWGVDQPLRQHQTIALSWANTNPKSKMSDTAGQALQYPKWILLGPDNQPYLPVAVGDATTIFMVGPTWPNGGYRLVIAGGEPTIGPVLSVDNPVRLFDLPPDITAQPAWTPLEANFADQIKLVGYVLPERMFEPGGAVPIQLVWQSLAPVQPDAVTFAVLLDANLRPYGSVDRYPSGFYSPMLWAVNEIVPDGFTVPIAPNAPPGVYYLHLGLYTAAPNKQLDYLPLVYNGQSTDSTAVVLGPIKIGGPPPDIVTQNPSPQTEISQTLGDQITLLGYDMAVSNSDPESELPNSESGILNSELTITLYWRADAPPPTNYTTFLHLRDASNQNAAQKDSPPAAGRYPTSLWEPGEVIIDELVLPLDGLPPGEYTPVVGLYDPASGNRLLAPGNPANEIPLQPVPITNGE